MGKGSTSYATTTGTGSSAPWQPQQPLIQAGFNEAQNQLNGPSTVAPLSPTTQAGLDMTQNIANSSTLPNNAAQFANQTLAGDFLGNSNAWMGPNGTNQNAYIDDLATSIGNKVVPGVMSQFALGGRAGDSPLAQGAVAEGISTALAPYMFGSAENQMGRMFTGYQNERDRQQQALGMSPAIGQAQYTPANALLGAGSIYDQYNQRVADNPADKLNQYMSVVGQPFGQQTSSFLEAPIAHTDTSGFRILGK